MSSEGGVAVTKDAETKDLCQVCERRVWPGEVPYLQGGK